MLRKVIVLASASLMIASVAFAVPGKDKNKTKTPVKLTAVTICPITGEANKGAGGTEVVGKYKVNFCCANCKPAFDKLSAKEKNKKIADALKKQKAAPSKS